MDKPKRTETLFLKNVEEQQADWKKIRGEIQKTK